MQEEYMISEEVILQIDLALKEKQSHQVFIIPHKKMP